MNRTRIKVCGVMDEQTIDHAARLGIDALGFVLAESPRQLTFDTARTLVAQVPPFMISVAVMRHPALDEFNRAAGDVRADMIQTEPHPDFNRDADRLLPVFHDSDHVAAVIDAYNTGSPHRVVHLEGTGRGGRGVAVKRETATDIATRHRVVLAGGLTPDNVAQIIEQVRPYAVDVSSGVETNPGEKDLSKMERFVAAVREGDTKRKDS